MRRHQYAKYLSDDQKKEISKRGASHTTCMKVAGVARPGKTAYERAYRRKKV